MMSPVITAIVSIFYQLNEVSREAQCLPRTSKNKCLVSHLRQRLFQGLRKNYTCRVDKLERGDFQPSPRF